jgi:primary-amine oxidase
MLISFAPRPCEVIKVAFKPVNFFSKNPALDVPPSSQQFNQSVLLSENHQQGAGAAEAQIGADGKVCCVDSKL